MGTTTQGRQHPIASPPRQALLLPPRPALLPRMNPGRQQRPRVERPRAGGVPPPPLSKIYSPLRWCWQRSTEGERVCLTFFRRCRKRRSIILAMVVFIKPSRRVGFVYVRRRYFVRPISSQKAAWLFYWGMVFVAHSGPNSIALLINLPAGPRGRCLARRVRVVLGTLHPNLFYAGLTNLPDYDILLPIPELHSPLRMLHC